MEHAWTMEEMKVTTNSSKVTSVNCTYCDKALDFEQPEYSDNPDDVTIQPAHNCQKLPADLEAVAAE